MPKPAYSRSATGNTQLAAMLLYYITDRKQFGGSEAEQRRKLLAKVAEAGAAGIDYVQLRERDLSGRELEELARAAVAAVKQAGTATRLLINSRVDVALASGADGVHLRADDVSAAEARAIAGSRTRFSVAVSCHTVDEVRLAWSQGADFAVFAPVFEKAGVEGKGREALRCACAAVPNFVVALGGITVANAADCLAAGAAGVAGIRLFQNGPAAAVADSLRDLRAGIPKRE